MDRDNHLKQCVKVPELRTSRPVGTWIVCTRVVKNMGTNTAICRP